MCVRVSVCVYVLMSMDVCNFAYMRVCVCMCLFVCIGARACAFVGLLSVYEPTSHSMCLCAHLCA